LLTPLNVCKGREELLMGWAKPHVGGGPRLIYL
jgi:hypothetical protein